MKTQTQQRTAARPEPEKPFCIVPMHTLRREREKVQQEAKGLELNIRPDVLVSFGAAAGDLNLEVNALATAVLEAFVDLVNEDHTIYFPLAFQQVDAG